MTALERPTEKARTGPVVTALSRGVIGACALMVVEFLVLLVSQGHRLSGVWEVQMAGVGLLPSWLILATLPGLAGGLLHLALCTGESSGFARRVTSSAVGASFTLVGYALGGGRHLQSASSRWGFALCLGLVLAGLAYAALPWLGRALDPKRRGALAVGLIGGGASILALETANTTVLVRLYPAFHLTLSGLAAVVAGWLCAWSLQFIWGPRASRLTVRGVVVGLFACGVGVLPASRAVAGFDNFRWVVGEGSPTLNWGVELAGMLAPPPAVDEDAAALPLGERRSQSALDLRGRDIFLISIDALRADHVGAYGYERPTTPAIDRLAEAGVLFEAAYAPTPHTSYSVTSLMTGKYMRPLLLQGAGADSDLWATILQAYDYRTAAFYPPAVFFIDSKRFSHFQEQKLGFEYAKVEFAEGDLRVDQYRRYLGGLEDKRRAFTWVHLFGPHEPYEAHDEYDFGERDIDLYDSEIRAADETVGRLVAIARERDPDCVVIVTSDHGEEFGDHGGRYHGSTVYDEQVRVPLVIDIPGFDGQKRVSRPVQTIDLLPTVLSGLSIPVPPRIRGADLSGAMLGTAEGEGRAVAETDDYTLMAEGRYRLICQRRSGACRLYDIDSDPGQMEDVSKQHPDVMEDLRARGRALAETHGKYETQGLRAEGKGWPAPILRGISGDADVAPVLARLLDDADTSIRRKSAQLLFTLGTSAQAPALRLAMSREEDEQARKWIALSLTRLGQGAPLVFELLDGDDLQMRRYAALALAEAGDDAGEDELIRWWTRRDEVDHEMALRMLRALSQIESHAATPALVRSLEDVRLRAQIASTLGEIGDSDARPHLLARLMKERYRSARLPLALAIVELGGDEELIVPLRRFLGVPERLEGGLELAKRAGILADVGGPKAADRRRLTQLSDSGIQLSVIVPPGPRGASSRIIVSARSTTGDDGEILVQPGQARIYRKKDTPRARNQPTIDSSGALKLALHPAQVQPDEPSGGFVELAADLPDHFGAKPGHHLSLELFAPRHIEIDALAVVPRREDLPPPPPEPWEPEKPQKGSRQDSAAQSAATPSP